MALAVRVYVDHLPEGAWERDGRGATFSEMYRRCRPELVALCARQLGSRSDAEEIAQEAFAKAWTSLDGFSTARPFWPWLATIARRMCVDQLRRRQRELLHRYRHEAEAVRASIGESPERIVELREEHAVVNLALRKLGPRDQRLLGLHDIDGWSTDEVAAFEGISREATRTAIRRARASLKKAYREAMGAPAVLPLLLPRWRRWFRDRARQANRAMSGTPAVWEGLGPVAAASAIALSSVFGGGGPTVSDGPAAPAPEPEAAVSPPSAPARGGAAPVVDAGPAAGTSAAPASPLPVALPPDGGATPEDAAFHSFAAASDGTVFAAGTVAGGCKYPPCAAIFASSDLGGSWSRLPAVGYAGGELLVSPSWPSDRRLFAVTLGGVQVSDDGGATFRSLTPFGGSAAFVPGSDGDRLLVGSTPGWAVEVSSGLATPLGLAPPPPGAQSHVLPLPSFASDGALLVGAVAPSAEGVNQSAVYRCEQSLCQVFAHLPGHVGPPNLVLAPNGDVLAWTRTGAFLLSRHGGVAGLQVPGAGHLTSVQVSDAGLLVTREGSTAPGAGGLYHSEDGGTTWQGLAGTLLPEGASAVSRAGAALFVAPTIESGGGVLCSRDGGVTWSSRCAR